MTQFPHGSAVGHSRSFALPVPEAPVEEHSQVQLRAPVSTHLWEQEDPFPLVRPSSDAAAHDSGELEIDVTFDHTPVSSVPPPPIAVARPLYENRVYDRPTQSAGVSTYDEDAPLPSRGGSRRVRVIAARIAFAVVFLGVIALLVYELRIALASGMRPF